MADQSVFAGQDVATFRSYASEVLVKQDRLSPTNMAMLITCIDYRYPHRIVDVMDSLGLTGKYDHFVLAGASLGAHVPDWQNVLIQHIKAALALQHHIKKIVILDHRDCGAYRVPNEIGVPSDILAHGLERDILPSVEAACHRSVAEKIVPILKAALAKEIPDLKIDAILLTRNEDDVLFTDA